MEDEDARCNKSPKDDAITDSHAQVFEAPPFFAFHHCNAYEHGPYVTVDTVAWDELSFTGFNVDSLSAAYYRCEAAASRLLFPVWFVACRVMLVDASTGSLPGVREKILWAQKLLCVRQSECLCKVKVGLTVRARPKGQSNGKRKEMGCYRSSVRPCQHGMHDGLEILLSNADHHAGGLAVTRTSHC